MWKIIRNQLNSIFDRHLLSTGTFSIWKNQIGAMMQKSVVSLFKNEEVQMTNAGNALTVIRMNLKSKYRNDLQW